MSSILTRVPRRLRFVVAASAALALSFTLATVGSSSAHAAIADDYTYTTSLVTTGPIDSALYQPTSSTPQQSIAVVVFHDTADMIGSAPCLQLAARGFTVMCAHNPYTQLPEIQWDDVATDIGGMVNYAYNIPGVQKVVLLGWSGGGADVAYYQAVAENGVAYCQNPERLDPCSSSLAGLKPASGVIMLDSIMGLAFQVMSDMDPSTSNIQGLSSSYNPRLYLFNPKNGFDSIDVDNDYSQSFLDEYSRAQGDREDALVALAEKTKQKITEGRFYTTDDAPFPIGRVAARPWQIDDSLINHTTQPETLITPSDPNGALSSTISGLTGAGVTASGEVERVTTPPAEQSPVPVSAAANSQWDGTQFTGGGNMTVDTFLSDFAIKSPDYQVTASGITGVDWGTSNTSTITNLEGVTSPLLIMSESGHYWVVPSEMDYAAAKSTDKTLAYVWGGSHSFTACTECLSPSSDYGNTEAETFNYMANWLAEKF